jgi:hypothetical protein
MPRTLKFPSVRGVVASDRRFVAKALIRLPVTLVLLPGRLAAYYTGLPKGSDHEQILSMFANTAFWTLVGILAAILAV